MSQPTLSRLENLPDWRALYRIGLGMIDLFCNSFARVPGCIVLDIDDTDDLVHGQQELALFNAHVGGYCFQPIKIFEASSGKPVAVLIRPGKRPAGEEIARILRHVIGRIRKHWPRVGILVRGDSHYCAEPVMALLETTHCEYILGFCHQRLAGRDLRVKPYVARQLLDHAAFNDVHSGYEHSDNREELLAALEVWCSHLERLAAPADNVAVLR